MNYRIILVVIIVLFLSSSVLAFGLGNSIGIRGISVDELDDDTNEEENQDLEDGNTGNNNENSDGNSNNDNVNNGNNLNDSSNNSTNGNSNNDNERSGRSDKKSEYDRTPVLTEVQKQDRKNEIRQFSMRIYGMRKNIEVNIESVVREQVVEEIEEPKILEKELISMNSLFTTRLIDKEQEPYIQEQLNSYVSFIEEDSDYKVELKKEDIKLVLEEDIDINDFLNSFW